MSDHVYKYGLYGRCSICKQVKLEKCKTCGESYFFTDSSKPESYFCINCKTHNRFTCDNSECNHNVKKIKTPRNEDERSRIAEYIKRQNSKEKDRRKYVVKESSTRSILKTVEVPVSSDKLEIFNSSSSEVNQEELDQIKKIIKKDKRSHKRLNQTTVKEAEENLLKEYNSKPPTTESTDNLEEKEIELIRKFWTSDKQRKNLERATEKIDDSEIINKEESKEDRRIINVFYDEHSDDDLDKKTVFELSYDETVFYDCRICGKKEQKISCPKCGKTDSFSLTYDSLACSCGNEIKIVKCDCGAKVGHNDFYVISEDGVKWQYSQEKSYYNYRKGRMLAFSECPKCGLFMAERCESCGSKVNFGKPNSRNEVYCKNCGTVNIFHCNNNNCKDEVKILKNPGSIEEKLELLKKVRDFKSYAQKRKQEKRVEKSKKQKNQNISTEKPTSNESSIIELSDSFIEKIDSHNKNLISSSFVNDVEKRVKERQILGKKLEKHNKSVEFTFYSKTKYSFLFYFMLVVLLIIFAISLTYNIEKKTERNILPERISSLLDNVIAFYFLKEDSPQKAINFQKTQIKNFKAVVLEDSVLVKYSVDNNADSLFLNKNDTLSIDYKKLIEINTETINKLKPIMADSLALEKFKIKGKIGSLNKK